MDLVDLLGDFGKIFNIINSKFWVVDIWSNILFTFWYLFFGVPTTHALIYFKINVNSVTKQALTRLIRGKHHINTLRLFQYNQAVRAIASLEITVEYESKFWD